VSSEESMVFSQRGKNNLGEKNIRKIDMWKKGKDFMCKLQWGEVTR
jgi:hypothetical protein